MTSPEEKPYLCFSQDMTNFCFMNPKGTNSHTKLILLTMLNSGSLKMASIRIGFILLTFN